MAQQYTQLVQSYEQLQSTYNSLTGPRGMQNLLYVPLANRNYLPATYSQMTGVINGTSTANPLTFRMASMPTVWASVPMQAPTTTSLRRSRPLMAALTSLALSSANSRSTTTTSLRFTRWLTLP